VNRRQQYSVSHSIDDAVDADAIRERSGVYECHPRYTALNAVIQVVNDMEDFVLVLQIYTYEGRGNRVGRPANRKLEAAREQRKNRGQRVA
jgi:hypothetical protein